MMDAEREARVAERKHVELHQKWIWYDESDVNRERGKKFKITALPPAPFGHPYLHRAVGYWLAKGTHARMTIPLVNLWNGRNCEFLEDAPAGMAQEARWRGKPVSTEPEPEEPTHKARRVKVPRGMGRAAFYKLVAAEVARGREMAAIAKGLGASREVVEAVAKELKEGRSS